jgi:hypothetical protein
MIEIRKNGDEIDEIIVRANGVCVHLEMMDTNHVWIGINDGEKHCHINISSCVDLDVMAEVEEATNGHV